jgi:hypothetical protein
MNLIKEELHPYVLEALKNIDHEPKNMVMLFEKPRKDFHEKGAALRWLVENKVVKTKEDEKTGIVFYYI